MVKQFTLTTGEICTVDDEDYDAVMQYNWCLDNRKEQLNYVDSIRCTTAPNPFITKFLAPRIGLKINEPIIYRNKNIYDNTRNNLANIEYSNLHLLEDTNLFHIGCNLLCSIEIVTTDSNPNKDCIVAICILPLNGNYFPHKGILPFDILIKPNIESINTIDTNLINTINKAYQTGFDQLEAINLFQTWFEKLKPDKCKIIPLTVNWLHKSKFIEKWLDPYIFNTLFSLNYRDIIQTICFINDRCDYQALRTRAGNKAFEARRIKNLLQSCVKNPTLRCIKYCKLYKKLVSSLY